MASMLGMQTQAVYGWTRRELNVAILQHRRGVESEHRLFCIDLSMRMGITKDDRQLYDMIFGEIKEFKGHNSATFKHMHEAWPEGIREMIVIPEHHQKAIDGK